MGSHFIDAPAIRTNGIGANFIDAPEVKSR